MASSSKYEEVIEDLASKGIDVMSVLQNLAGGSKEAKPVTPVAAVSRHSMSVNEKSDDDVVLTKEVSSAKAVRRRTRSTVTPLSEGSPKGKRAKTSKTPVFRKSSRLTTRPDSDEKEDGNKNEYNNMEEVPLVVSKKTVVPEMIISHEWLRSHCLDEVVEVLKAQQWDKLFQTLVEVNEEQVREFYSSLKVEDKTGMTQALFTFNNEEYSFTSRELGKWIGVPHQGYSGYAKKVWPGSVAREEVFKRIGSNAKGMGIVGRVIHRIMCQNITPRLQKHDQLLIQDFMLLDLLLLKEPINLPRQILLHMSHASSTPNHGLPFPSVVKIILTQFELYKPENEVVLSNEFDATNCERLGFKFDKVEGWTKAGTFEPVEKETVAEKGIVPTSVKKFKNLGKASGGSEMW